MPSPDDLFRPGPNRTAKEYLFKAIFTNDKAADADTMAKYIVPGTCVVDVGSHVGYFSRRFADRNPGGLVLAFEPQSVPRSIATVASFFRKERNIVQFPLALGKTPGLLELKIPIKSKGQIGIGLAHVGSADDLSQRFDVKREIVACEMLDNVMARVGVEKISMIKIDVEGGEQDVLRGAEETLKRYRPVVVCETGDSMGRFGDSVAGLRAYMAERNYKALDLRTGKEISGAEPAIDTAFLPK
jgi:FkbM family methyltransferase